MGNGRTSARLARLRTRRDRVTARQGHTERRRLRVDWARLGTIVAIIAGIGTLLFTGVATYYGAEISKDQLRQSQEDAEQESRDQAMRISFWVERDERIHVVNRSSDPVSAVFVTFDAWSSGRRLSLGPKNMGISRVHFLELYQYVPPCSEIVIAKEEMRFENRQTSKWEQLPDRRVLFYEMSVQFVDHDGRKWVRSIDKLTQWQRGSDEHSHGNSLTEPLRGMLPDVPVAKSIEPCHGNG
ncbi:hypothetical protein [Streptomyces phaeochromogenes]